MKPKPKRKEIDKSDIDVLRLMINHYEERGGGYSQKEALKSAIEIFKDYVTCYDIFNEREREFCDSIDTFLKQYYPFMSFASRIALEEILNKIKEQGSGVET